MMEIPYTRPSITEREVELAADAARNGWGPSCYEYIEQFEEKFAAYLGVKHAIATSSCTGAMHLGLAGLNIGENDEVILADTNWIATVAPFVHLKSKPIFVDITERSWCIDPLGIESKITSRTKAIVATHLYGNLCEMDELESVANHNSLVIIEDAAEAIGSTYFNKKAGSMGKFGTFSFHGTKTLSTGEGGMFVTNDSDLFERVLTLSNHGRSKNEKRQFWPVEVGYKYKMSNIQAAIGCAQLERVGELVAKKREILGKYKEILSSLDCVSLNYEDDNLIPGAWMPTVVFSSESKVTREQIIEEFTTANIDARVFFHPLSSLPMFTSVSANRISHDLCKRAINLPSFHDMTDHQIERVAQVIFNLANRKYAQ